MMNIALAHGVLGFDRFGPIHYFNGVADALRADFHGCRVVSPATPPIGTVERRATTLADAIQAGLSSGTLDAAAGIHIVAHSMGGLDARFLIARDLGDWPTELER
jgi:triacylglycerol lipase